MGVTIKDVAKKCGLSITTVSLVLNNKENRISEKTKQMITEAAQELNYIPNRMAVGLASKKALSIGLVTFDCNSNTYLSLMQATETACQSADLFLIIYNLSVLSMDSLDTSLQKIIRNVDGLILDPSFCKTKYNEKLKTIIEKANIPIVALSSIGKEWLPNTIAIDRKQGAYTATSHLLQLNHHRIAFFVPKSYTNIYTPLIAGYREALEDQNIEFQEDLIFEEQESQTLLNDILLELANDGVHAAISYSDVLTSRIYYAANQTGIKIPDILSVLSLEDSSFFGCFNPPTSAMSLHSDRVARKAVHLLKKMISATEPLNNKPETVPPFFFLRNSTIDFNDSVNIF